MCRLRALILKCRMWCYVLTPAFLSYATRMNWTIVKDFSDDVSHVIVAPCCPTRALQLNSDPSLLPGPTLSFRAKDAGLLLGGCCCEPQQRQLCPLSLMLLFRAAGL